MIKKFYFILLLLIIFLQNLSAGNKPSLVFYVGSTMSQAMNEIVKIFEEKNNCKIKIVSGASRTLYNLIKTSKQGDLFLPGSNSFRINNLKDGYLLEAKYIGYNQAVVFTKEKNEIKIKQLDDLLDENIAIMLCDPTKGSIGRESEKLLKRYKGKEFSEAVYNNCIRIALDSKDLFQALNQGKVDAVINWKATHVWSKDKSLNILNIDEKYAPKKELFISLLKFSKYPDITKDFIAFVTSSSGQLIMKKHGFKD